MTKKEIKMYKLDGNVFINKNGEFSNYIVTELIVDETQLEKQENSLEEYNETHEKEQHSPIIKHLMNEFQSLIALHTIMNNINGTILDVGCGISKKYPLYFDKLKNSTLTYIGLDPFEVNQREREYMFINGKFEGLHKYLEIKFDYLLFSTSLDHFENLDAVRNEIQKVLKPQGLVFFWVGLHDGNIVARQSLAHSFKNFNILNKLEVIKTIIKIPLQILRTYLSILKREDKLKQNIPLDNLHFHYFTKSSLDDYMNSLGELIDKKHIPLTNSIMYVIRPNNELSLRKNA